MTDDHDQAVAVVEARLREYRDALTAASTARAAFAEAIAEATRRGVRQTRLVQVTGYTRENVRQLVKAAGGAAADGESE